ncbi:unnamed protein product [Linum tenue]|nr:unnamed protein product [Linum tenue]
MSPSATTKIHVTALDGIVNVNSLFTLALFLGLSQPISSSAASLVTDPSCAAASSTGEDFLVFHVYAFSSFLFSSLVALAIKQAIVLSDNSAADITSATNFAAAVVDNVLGPGYYESLVHVNLKALRLGTLISGLGSILGCGFLTLALVNLVQIKLGVLSCGSLYTVAAIAPLVTLVPLASIVYVFLLLHAFTR